MATCCCTLEKHLQTLQLLELTNPFLFCDGGSAVFVDRAKGGRYQRRGQLALLDLLVSCRRCYWSYFFLELLVSLLERRRSMGMLRHFVAKMLSPCADSMRLYLQTEEAGRSVYLKCHGTVHTFGPSERSAACPPTAPVRGRKEGVLWATPRSNLQYLWSV